MFSTGYLDIEQALIFTLCDGDAGFLFDGGRSMTQAEKRIQELEKELESAKGVEKTKIRRKIENIRKKCRKEEKRSGT